MSHFSCLSSWSSAKSMSFFVICLLEASDIGGHGHEQLCALFLFQIPKRIGSTYHADSFWHKFCPLVHNSHHSLLSHPIQNAKPIALLLSAWSLYQAHLHTDQLSTTNQHLCSYLYLLEWGLGGRLLLYLTSPMLNVDSSTLLLEYDKARGEGHFSK